MKLTNDLSVFVKYTIYYWNEKLDVASLHCGCLLFVCILLNGHETPNLNLRFETGRKNEHVML